MSAPIIILNRLIKIIRNIAKVSYCPFHFIFPNKRFTIPKQSNQIIKSKTTAIIPKVIWQTNYTNRVGLLVYLNYLFNYLLFFNDKYRYMSTKDHVDYINKKYTKKMTEFYNKLTDGASKVDVWRPFALNTISVIFMNIITYPIWPLLKIIKPDNKEIVLLDKQHFTNCFIISSKNNPTLKKALNITVDNIKKLNLDVCVLINPEVFNRTIGDTKLNHRFYRIRCIQGNFTNKYF